MSKPAEDPELLSLIADERVLMEEIARFGAEYEAFLSRPLDTLAIVLRSHLLIEHYLQEYLEAQNPAIKNWDKARLTFAQKLALADHSQGIISVLAPGMRNLNTLRNRAAHTLKSDLAPGDVSAMLDFVRMWHKASGRPVPEIPSTIVEAFSLRACSMLSSATVPLRNEEYNEYIKRLTNWASKRRTEKS